MFIFIYLFTLVKAKGTWQRFVTPTLSWRDRYLLVCHYKQSDPWLIKDDWLLQLKSEQKLVDPGVSPHTAVYKEAKVQKHKYVEWTSYPQVGALVSPNLHPASAQRRRTHCEPADRVRRLLKETRRIHAETQIVQTAHRSSLIREHPLWADAANTARLCSVRSWAFSSCTNNLLPHLSVDTLHQCHSKKPS